jgi:NTP pyrophosphohydrolases containing a Zn-finger, probably nucleic-acid-binding
MNDSDYGLFFYGDDLLLRQSDRQFILPLADSYLAQFIDDLELNRYCVGYLQEKNLYAVSLPESIQLPDTPFCFFPVRRLLETLDLVLFHWVCKAKQLMHWHRISRFCGVCGGMNQPISMDQDHAKRCVSCDRISYPSYSLAVMVLITRGKEILLARSPHFKPGVYSALAGFVSPAETAEAAVMREVSEEVGLTIEGIQYFGSQAWPFPNSFMLAYTAHYVSGDLQIDRNELEDAQWFSVDNLPLLPAKSSISRRLIDDFIKS